MNWEAFSAIAEMVGSLAVLVTLVYLAIQTKHARTANEANIQWQKANAQRELSMMWATNPDAVNLLFEFGLEKDQFPEELTERSFRYMKINQAILEMLQASYVSAISAEDKKLVESRILATVTRAGFVATWPRIKALQVFREDFVKVVEKGLSAGV